MNKLASLAACAFLLSMCNNPGINKDRSNNNGDDTIVITNATIGKVSACNFNEVLKAFAVKNIDTSKTDFEMSELYSVTGHLPDSSFILLETPSLKINYIQRFTSNCKKIRTVHGYHVGTTLKELLEQKEDITVITDEYDVSFRILSDSIYFRIDDKYTKSLPADSVFHYLEKRNPYAAIKEFILFPSCNKTHD